MSGVARRDDGARSEEAWVSMHAMVHRLGASQGLDVKAVWKGLIDQHNAGDQTEIGGTKVATAIRKVDGVSRLFVHDVSAHTVERAVVRANRERMEEQVRSFLARSETREEAPSPSF